MIVACFIICLKEPICKLVMAGLYLFVSVKRLWVVWSLTKLSFVMCEVFERDICQVVWEMKREQREGSIRERTTDTFTLWLSFDAFCDKMHLLLFGCFISSRISSQHCYAGVLFVYLFMMLIRLAYSWCLVEKRISLFICFEAYIFQLNWPQIVFWCLTTFIVQYIRPIFFN